MAQNNKNNLGNDHVIAVFFKKSIFLMALIALMVLIYFALSYLNKKKEKLIEKKYQPPTVLQKKNVLPTTQFSEQSQERGLEFKHFSGAIGEKMLPETMGSGVAFIDFDNDGDQDVLFANGTHWKWDKTNDSENNPTQQLFANDGKGYFVNVTKSMGLDHEFYGTGIAIGDVNNDGFDDIFIAAVGKNKLFINQAGKSFELSQQSLDCTQDGWSTSSGFFDYDQDGDLDLMVLNYIEWSRDLDLRADYKLDGIGRAYGPPSNFPGTHSCIFENNQGQFADVTTQSGLMVKNPATDQFSGKSLALLFVDINNDEWQDVIVANDTTKNFAFINQKHGTFIEQSSEFGLAYDASGKATGAMGLDAGFYKNNNDMAVTVGNFANEMTSFYVNRENMGFFTDESVITGIGPLSRLALSFGLFFFDFDLDGRQDFFQTNGHVENDINKVQSAQHYAQKSQLFWNCGNDCERTFIPHKNAGSINQIDLIGRAAAYADIDNDGDQDVIVTQVSGPAQLFINDNKENNWIGIKLTHNNKVVSGAKITVYAGENTQQFIYTNTKSYLSQVQMGQIIGLGNDKLDKIVINYQGGEKIITHYNLNSWNNISLE